MMKYIKEFTRPKSWGLLMMILLALQVIAYEQISDYNTGLTLIVVGGTVAFVLNNAITRTWNYVHTLLLIIYIIVTFFFIVG